MSEKSPKSLAKKLLEGGLGGLEDLYIYVFDNDESAHDDDRIERLYAEFSSELDRVQKELIKDYGKPSRTGETDDEVIPLNGIFRFAIWEVGDLQLFVTASHEDRGLPVLLMMGTA
jgi:hypothetical protein